MEGSSWCMGFPCLNSMELKNGVGPRTQNSLMVFPARWPKASKSIPRGAAFVLFKLSANQRTFGQMLLPDRDAVALLHSPDQPSHIHIFVFWPRLSRHDL